MRGIFFILLITGSNAFAMDVSSAIDDKISSFTWATVTNSRTLEFMAHTGLKALVPRGLLMEKYGLPVVAGSSIATGAFDPRNSQSLSGDLVTSFGGLCDLARIAGFLSLSHSRHDIIKNLRTFLMEYEKRDDLDRELPVAKEILCHLRKFEFDDDKAEFPRIESFITPEDHVQVADGLRWDADEFFAKESPGFAVAFASSTISDELVQANGSGCPYEHLVSKELELGVHKDIQYVVVSESHVDKISELLASMFPAEEERPEILTFENIYAAVHKKIMTIMPLIPGEWPRYSLEERDEILKKDVEFNLDFLPAFLSEHDPLVLTCKSSQFEQVLTTLEKNHFKIINLRSQFAPSLTSLILRAPGKNYSDDDKVMMINEWIKSLRTFMHGQHFPDGREIIVDNVPIEIEFGL